MPNYSRETIDIENIGRIGFVLFIRSEPHTLLFDDFPMLREAKIREIFNVKLLKNDVVYWKDLNLKLTMDMIKYPEKYGFGTET